MGNNGNSESSGRDKKTNNKSVGEDADEEEDMGKEGGKGD